MRLILFLIVLLLGGNLMASEPETKCSRAGFEHAWDDTTPYVIYATNPPTFPQPTFQCLNCKLIRREITTKETRIVYDTSEVKQPEDKGA